MASPFEFFIVQKKDGANHLDGKYTVFGEVIKGMDTVDKIASIPTDEMDWPIIMYLSIKLKLYIKLSHKGVFEIYWWNKNYFT